MKKLFLLGAAACSAALLLTMVVTGPANGQVTKGKTRPLTTHQLMEGLVGPNCGGLSKALKAKPADAKAWKKVATQAALLNEASYILMADGRCPDGVWAGAAKTLREGSAAVLKKIEAKDAAGAQAAFAGMTKACGACHKVHKKAHKH